MSVRDLVVRPGDRVSLAGSYVRRNDGDWLDLAIVSNLMIHPAGWKSDRSIRVISFDPAGVPDHWGANNDIIRGWARVTGVWREDTITAERQTPVERTVGSYDLRLACDPPPGGWDTGPSTTEVPELEDLRASGAIVVDSWLREKGGALVLRVAAGDVALANRVLGPLLPRRLCVTASRYTADDLRNVEEALDSHHKEWLFETWATRNLTSDGQPHATAELLRVTDGLAEWADRLPDGLLHLTPTITPAEPTSRTPRPVSLDTRTCRAYPGSRATDGGVTGWVRPAHTQRVVGGAGGAVRLRLLLDSDIE